eukprot:3253336-Rhodomonas_salina.3
MAASMQHAGRQIERACMQRHTCAGSAAGSAGTGSSSTRYDGVSVSPNCEQQSQHLLPCVMEEGCEQRRKKSRTIGTEKKRVKRGRERTDFRLELELLVDCCELVIQLRLVDLLV